MLAITLFYASIFLCNQKMMLEISLIFREFWQNSQRKISEDLKILMRIIVWIKILIIMQFTVMGYNSTSTEISPLNVFAMKA